jgi:hypothetical protein
MCPAESTEERVRKQFQEKWKEYNAHDRTLDALAAFRFILEYIDEIRDETIKFDFRPRIAPQTPDLKPYTPDGVIWQRPCCSFLLELKTSWNKDDVDQVMKYAKGQGYLQADGSLKAFAEKHCLLLGYQDPPGEPNLDKLFTEWERGGLTFPLVVFRYSLEFAPEGDRVFFSRIPFERNGLCPPSALGKAMNSARGCSVKADNFRFVKSKFHKANDQVVDSYGAVMWWTKYAIHYLTEDQRAEMAANGRLSSPLVIPVAQLDQVPSPGEVEVPLTAKDVKRALEFLRQAGLVVLKKLAGCYQVKLKGDRYVRFPHGTTLVEVSGQQEIAAKIITRWATNKIKHPLPEPHKKARKPLIRSGKRRDTSTLPLFPDIGR